MRVTRDRCVYELAAFNHFSRDAPIDVLPLRLAVFTISTQAALAVCLAVYLLLTSALSPYVEEHEHLIVTVPQLLMSAPAFAAVSHFGQHFRREQRMLVHQLEAFDARHAACSVVADREVILRSIRMMYSGGVDEFNSVVRTKLSHRVSSTFNSQRALLPYGSALLALAPIFGLILSVTASFADNQALPKDAAYRATYAVCVLGWLFAGFPLMLALAMHCVRREAGLGRHVLVGIGVACAKIVHFYVATLLPMRLALPTDAPACASAWTRMLRPALPADLLSAEALQAALRPESWTGDCVTFPSWAAPLLACALNAPCALATWCFYHRRTVSD